jgi:hypothetical protein
MQKASFCPQMDDGMLQELAAGVVHACTMGAPVLPSWVPSALRVLLSLCELTSDRAALEDAQLRTLLPVLETCQKGQQVSIGISYFHALWPQWAGMPAIDGVPGPVLPAFCTPCPCSPSTAHRKLKTVPANFTISVCRLQQQQQHWLQPSSEAACCPLACSMQP